MVLLGSTTNISEAPCHLRQNMKEPVDIDAEDLVSNVGVLSLPALCLGDAARDSPRLASPHYVFRLPKVRTRSENL